MRIFCSTLHWFPPKIVDVAELFLVELAKRGVVTEWYAQRGQPGRYGTVYLKGQKFFLPLNIPPNKGLIKFINKFLYWCFDWIVALRQLRNPPDIFQARDKYIGALAGLFAARLAKRKFVYWMSYPFPEHDLEMAKITPFPQKLFHRIRGELAMRLLYRFIIPHADHVFVQSAQMKCDLVGYGIAAEKMTPVPMGVTGDVFLGNAGERSETVVGRIVYLGTLAKARRMEMLIHAMSEVVKHVPSAHLFMIGDGNHPSERQFLEAEAERLGVSDRITFTGFLPMKEAWKIVETASVCVSPIYPTQMFRVSSPTKIVEYMALGKPVIASDLPDQSQIIAESGAGLCVEWSESAFAEAISELLKNPEKADEMGKKGPEWVRQNRVYDKIAEQVHARYMDILGKTG